MKSVGLCVGASNITYAVVKEEAKGLQVERTGSCLHEGDPRGAIARLLKEGLLDSAVYLGVTGRKYRTIIDAPTVSEPEAVEEACRFLLEPGGRAIRAVVSAGGETFMVYVLDGEGRISRVVAGNKCASGTGEFFLQQLKRLDLGLEEALEEADGEAPFPVSGRCSVFCKSDCTHALNKGAGRGGIVAGLCKMMSSKIVELLQGLNGDGVLLVGGVSRNRVMVNFLKEAISGIRIPPFAPAFEALGAALWAFHGKKETPPGDSLLMKKGQLSFSRLPAPGEFLPRVRFHEVKKGGGRDGEALVLGLDVGSTTTKAVLIGRESQEVLASCYLRTLGDPVAAARECYRRLRKGAPAGRPVLGLGVTGSGRQIAALHALTPAVVNEIIAHATAALHFDSGVDTIFEIGGQDAKYTLISGGVPVDYAMNEACSAGTGSFLEEAAGESLGISVEEIGVRALKSRQPLNFSDQCAAFINSDIKTAIQEGCSPEDIAAGIVYSVCLNYSNRVKGNRSVGKKVFMQGGVCYNPAVPAAMAALTGREVVVPPNPGLMGAFGAALETVKALEGGLLKPSSFDLEELAAREIAYGQTFRCRGDGEGCDRGCSINRVRLKGRVYPFGGACNKYVNLLGGEGHGAAAPDLVKKREALVMQKYGAEYCRPLFPPRGKRVGMGASLMASTLFPLYYNFFASLGFEVVAGGDVTREGLDRKGAAYCYPVEMAHGRMAGLLAKKPHVIFIPHVKSLPVPGGGGGSVTCPFVQGEPYYMEAAFPELGGGRVLSPLLEMENGYGAARDSFIRMGQQLGVDPRDSARAFSAALRAQEGFHRECRRLGKQFLDKLEEEGVQRAVVLFGRSYNAFSGEVNMAVPGKFSSRGCAVIPYDFLPLEGEEGFEGMYWSAGQMILKAARFVKTHPRLYGAYITNFSCGPDSFITGYFRDIMGSKPSLTLELDSHTADAGLDTRIEAFLDIIQNYRNSGAGKSRLPAAGAFRRARTLRSPGGMGVKDSRGRVVPLDDSGVLVLVPAMGRWGGELLAASFRYQGVRAEALPPPGEREFKLGQSLSTCKECLPFILTLGSFMAAIRERASGDLLVCFMPETSGPCRFGQYNVQMQQVVKKERLADTAFLSLTATNGYAGLGSKMALRAWQAVIINDVLEESYSALLTLAENRAEALNVYYEVGKDIVGGVERHGWQQLRRVLLAGAQKLRTIRTKKTLDAVPKVALIGEIYVRQDSFSLKDLVTRLADRGIMARTAPVAEWLYYCDYLVKKGLVDSSGGSGPVRSQIQAFLKRYFERDIKGIFARSGFYQMHMLDIEGLVREGGRLLSPGLTGEAILTIGAAMTEGEDVSGALAISPFGCMPGRMAEAIIKQTLDRNQGKEDRPSIPFLAVETDGNSLTPVVEARLDAFCLQVQRRHQLRFGAAAGESP